MKPNSNSPTHALGVDVARVDLVEDEAALRLARQAHPVLQLLALDDLPRRVARVGPARASALQALERQQTIAWARPGKLCRGVRRRAGEFEGDRGRGWQRARRELARSVKSGDRDPGSPDGVWKSQWSDTRRRKATGCLLKFC